MFGQKSQEFDAMMKPGIEAFNYWISFFPTAPLFGVEWRFGNGFNLPMTEPAKTSSTVTSIKPKMKPQAKKPAGNAAPVAKVQAKPADVIPLTKPSEPAPKPAPKTVAKATTKPSPVKVAPKAAPKAPPATKAAPKAEAPAKPAAPKKTRSGKPAGLLAEAPAKIDDLKQIKGIGPGLEKQLNGLGVYQFEQMAGFSTKDLTWIDKNLTAFKGRCFRDDWSGQAKSLIA